MQKWFQHFIEFYCADGINLGHECLALLEGANVSAIHYVHIYRETEPPQSSETEFEGAFWHQERKETSVVVRPTTGGGKYLFLSKDKRISQWKNRIPITFLPNQADLIRELNALNNPDCPTVGSLGKSLPFVPLCWGIRCVRIGLVNHLQLKDLFGHKSVKLESLMIIFGTWNCTRRKELIHWYNKRGKISPPPTGETNEQTNGKVALPSISES